MKGSVVLTFQPTCEQEVVALFCGAIADLGFKSIRKIGTPFPDCVAINNENELVRIEFEFLSGNFIQHGHDHHECDLIVCWEDDSSTKLELPVMELCRVPQFAELQANPEVEGRKRGTSERILNFLYQQGLTIDEFKKELEGFHPDYRKSEARSLVARMYANQCEPDIHGDKLSFSNKPSNYDKWKWAVRDDKVSVKRASDLLNRFGYKV